MDLRHLRHALPLAITVATAALGACGDDGGTTERAAERPAKNEKIVIKVHADLQDVVDRGEVLSGSSLGNAPFCRGGKFTGGHGNTMIFRTFFCADGNLELG